MTTLATEHVDVLIVGAGLSGVGVACHLQRDRPGTSFAILEARESLGGTWDLFRYPGIRSDSDMYTLGYAFKPWTDRNSIADGSAILAYVRETAQEYGVDTAIRYRHRVLSAAWSSEHARWTVTARREDTGETVTLTCSWLQVCSGYYRYDEGFRPTFPGEDDFAGRIVHPQHWPEDLDFAGKRIVVIGSGATAVTLVPSMAAEAAHVTMLQRSPTYIAAVPQADPIAAWLRKHLSEERAYRVIRWKNVLFTQGVFQLSRKKPELMKAILRKRAAAALPTTFDVATHLAPSYNPWDQRLCAVPDGDLFRAIRHGKADIVTDVIERFDATGVQLASGTHLDADIIVTATGLNLLAVGGMTLAVDGREIDLATRLAYKGMMLSGVPNFSWTIGYTNASWTLKADLVARYVCRLLGHMERHGYASVVPEAPVLDGDDELVPLIDLQAGYVLRSAALLPKQGPVAPWRLHQNYVRDIRLLGRGPVTDGVRFGHAGDRAPDEAAAAGLQAV
jgi:cation diffusion facilitator CzcD-associated flavoprotein CzcO